MDAFVDHFQGFLLILARLFGLFLVAPFFSSDSIPFSFKAIFAFLCSLVLYPIVGKFLPQIPGHMVNYGLLTIGELFVGLILGFLVSIVFAAFQLAGDFFNTQIGFSYTELLDPVTQTSLPVISTLKSLMATALFLIIGAHRFLIETLAGSFERIHLFHFAPNINKGLFLILQEAIGAMFLVAFKIALPVIGILFLVSLAEGMMGKAAQQMNVMSLSFPLKFFIGIMTLVVTMTFISVQMVQGIQISLDKANTLVRQWPK